MTKERIILAIVAIIAGLIVASSMFYFYQGKKPPSSPAESPTPSVFQNGKSTLIIESPENESITDEKVIAVKGKSNPHALIVLTTDTKDFTLMSGEDGVFEQEITLSASENILTITAYPENGASETKEIIVTYTTEEF